MGGVGGGGMFTEVWCRNLLKTNHLEDVDIEYYIKVGIREEE
jgi:hypothetical protein